MVREYYVVIECTVRVEVHDRANAAGNDESLHTRRCGLANEVHRAFHGALSFNVICKPLYDAFFNSRTYFHQLSRFSTAEQWRCNVNYRTNA